MITQFSNESPVILILSIIVGIAVLVMGRQIFWVFIAGLGFVLGLLFSSQLYDAQFGWQTLLISAGIAIIGALLAYTVQRLAAGVAGFATGWYLSLVVFGYFNVNLGQIESVIPYIIGIISGILLFLYFDWGVIIASSLAGAAIIISATSMSRNIELVLLGMLAVIGFVIQTIWFMQEK
jgi:hypothetical protein